MIDWSTPTSTQDLIHDKTVIVDLAFNKRDKQYFLDRTQFWKNKWQAAGYKRILICTFPIIDSIAMFFAAAELGIMIETSNLTDGPEPFRRRGAGVDINYINPAFGSTWFDPNKVEDSPIADLPLYILNEKELNSEFEANRPTYTPTYIDPSRDLIGGEVLGLANTYVPHTSGTYIGAAMMSKSFYDEDDHFGSVNGVTHIGLTSQVVIAPLLAGTTYYTMNNFYDLVMMANRNIFTKMWFYDVHLKITEWHPNFTLPPNVFKGTTVFVGGNKPSPRTMDVIFNAGADKIISCYGSLVSSIPIAVLEIDTPNFDVFGAGIGKIYPGTEVKVVNGQLWAKSEGQSVHVKSLDEDGYFNTGDYVEFKNGEYHILGRSFIDLPSGARIFPVDIQNAVQLALDDDIYSYSEYLFDQPTATDRVLNFYPMSIRCQTIFNRCYENILVKMRELLENPNIEKIVIHKVVDDASLFAGRINLIRVKQLIAEGKTL